MKQNNINDIRVASFNLLPAKKKILISSDKLAKPTQSNNSYWLYLEIKKELKLDSILEANLISIFERYFNPAFVTEVYVYED